ncbi:hypothetical protein D779_1408 [Imhoffiella purpurea]|uniref:Uncharacterized protein n=1 Tax=Imhoffiella purpurea TaxID=1249627 RepID=W9V7Q0_9GAMM|nr:hypothetical protein D779_1408 [Imhoffiella purpurea]
MDLSGNRRLGAGAGSTVPAAFDRMRPGFQARAPDRLP